MSDTFDPYRKWLGISPRDQPPHHYRLLGIDLFESDQDVLATAADARMVHLKTFQAGKYSALSQGILNEVAAAKICLLNPERKAEYDRELRKQIQVSSPSPPKPTPKPPPSAVPHPLAELPLPTSMPRFESPMAASARRRRQQAVVAVLAGLVLVALLVFYATSDGDKPIAQQPKPPVSESANRWPGGISQKRKYPPKPDARPIEPEFEERNEEAPPVDMRLPVEESPVDMRLPVEELSEPEPITGETMESGMVPDQPAADLPMGPKLLAVPDGTAQFAAEEGIREIYKEEFAVAKEPQQKLALAKMLFRAAKQTEDDPAARFVMFRLAGELAAESGDSIGALSAIDQIGEEYDIDSPQMKYPLLSKAFKAIRDPRRMRDFVEAATCVAGEAIEMDDHEAAGRFAKLALSASRRTKNARLERQVADWAEEIKQLQQRFVKFQKALGVLAEDPANREANLTAGRWYCFNKGLGDQGLPLLAKGDDPALAEVARAELAAKDAAGADDPKEQIELGDLWWERAENEKGTAKMPMLSRAAYWYKQGLPNVKGLAKTKVEKRLDQLDQVLGYSGSYRPSRGRSRFQERDTEPRDRRIAGPAREERRARERDAQERDTVPRDSGIRP